LSQSGGLLKNNQVIKKWSVIMQSPEYELFVNIIGIFNILCIVVKQVDLTDSTAFIYHWMFIQISINILFLIELLSDFCILGFSNSYK